MQVVVLSGGLSPERDVSLRSGRRVAEALRAAEPSIEVTECDVDATLIGRLRQQRPACVIPLLHGAAGEDGSLRDVLEALAIRLRFNPEGGSRDHTVNTLATHSELHGYLTPERRRHFQEGWFLRAESFYNVASDIQLGEREWGSGTFDRDGGRSLHERSHGEAFLALMQHRLRGGGCYLFDEPEAALSPQRQLSVLALLHRLVLRGSQFVIATHSPILLAYPHAAIHELGGWGIRQVPYEETETVRVTRDFLERR